MTWISKIEDLEDPRDCRSLTINGCPVEEQDGVNLRLEVLIFRPLQQLNGEEVTPEEQEEARALQEKRLEEEAHVIRRLETISWCFEAERLRQEEEDFGRVLEVFRWVRRAWRKRSGWLKRPVWRKLLRKARREAVFHVDPRWPKA